MAQVGGGGHPHGSGVGGVVALSPTMDALVAPVRGGGGGAQVGDGGRAAQVVGVGRLHGGGAGGRRHWT